MLTKEIIPFERKNAPGNLQPKLQHLQQLTNNKY